LSGVGNPDNSKPFPRVLARVCFGPEAFSPGIPRDNLLMGWRPPEGPLIPIWEKQESSGQMVKGVFEAGEKGVIPFKGIFVGKVYTGW